jgi:tetratricopeptide (TPR) repeat protein
MSRLPFVVVHGWWISKVLVVACGALALLVAWLFARRKEHRRVARERAKRGEVVVGLKAGQVTIHGKLRGRAATAFGDIGRIVRERSDEVVLDVDGQSVVLRGEIEVVAGTRAAATRRGVPPGFVTHTASGPWRAYAVGDGDEVFATGKLSNVAGSAEGAYRDSAGQWVLEPPTTPPVIELYAARPPTPLPPFAVVRIVAITAIWSLVGYGGLAWLGTRLVDSAKHAPREHVREVPFAGLALAAALPHVRSAALEELDWQMRSNYARTDDVLAMRFQLAELRGGCSARAELENEEEHYDEALATATSCGDASQQIDALVHLGRYAEAAALLPKDSRPDPDRLALISIATGRWSDAASAADDMIRRHDDASEDADDRYRCLAAWFRIKAGQPAKLLEDVGAPGNGTCAVVRAMLAPPAERTRAMETAWSQTGRLPPVRDLAWAYGALGVSDYAFDLYDAISLLTGERETDARTWLSQIAMSSRTAPDPEATANRAILAAIRGDVAGAAAQIEAVRHLGPDPEDIDGARMGILLHLPGEIAPDPAITHGHPAVAPLADLRDGRLSRDLHLAAYGRDDAILGALPTAIAGDGASLARALEDARPMWISHAGVVLAVVPRIKQHRAELATAFHNFHGDYNAAGHMPFNLLSEVSLRRDLARLAGDEASAKHWQALIDAQLPVLDDPEKVIALVLWQG